MIYPISRCQCKAAFRHLVEMSAMKGFSRDILTLCNYRENQPKALAVIFVKAQVLLFSISVEM